MEQWSNEEQVGENLFKTKEGQAIAPSKHATLHNLSQFKVFHVLLAIINLLSD
ncbi:hypothetical protein [Paenibacillus sp. 203]|uniref:hypothetical protein n=1 Tax=Paenibacillus sp. 203 TaxID=3096765 RepID=UPI00300BC892